MAIKRMEKSCEVMYSSRKACTLSILALGILIFVSMFALSIRNVCENKITSAIYFSCLGSIVISGIILLSSIVAKFWAENEYRKYFALVVVSGSLTDVVVRPDRIKIQYYDNDGTAKRYELKFLNIIDSRFSTELDIPIMHIAKGKLKKIYIPYNSETEWCGYEIKSSC